MAWRRGQTYGQDLRERVLAASDLTARQAAARKLVPYYAALRARVDEVPDATLAGRIVPHSVV
jgi:hypothetical protein